MQVGSGLILCCRAKKQDPGSYTKGEPGAPPHPLSPIRLEGEEKSTSLSAFSEPDGRGKPRPYKEEDVGRTNHLPSPVAAEIELSSLL